MSQIYTVLLALVTIAPICNSLTVAVFNHQSKVNYTNAPVRLAKVSSTGASATVGGKSVQTQVEVAPRYVMSSQQVSVAEDGGCTECFLWATVSMPSSSNLTFSINDNEAPFRKPASPAPRMSLAQRPDLDHDPDPSIPSAAVGHVSAVEAKDKHSVVLANEYVEIELAGPGVSWQEAPWRAAVSSIPTPFLSITRRADDSAAQSSSPAELLRLGGSSWALGNASTLRSFRAAIDAAGPIVAQVTHTYIFDSTAEPSPGGVDGGPTKAGGTTQATFVWRLEAGDKFGRVQSSFNLGDSSSLSLDLSSGFKPDKAVMDAFSYAPTKTSVPTGANQRLSIPLKHDQRLGNTLGYAFPKWTQGADARWSVGATDGTTTLAIVAARLGSWDWPLRKSLVLEKAGEQLPAAVTDDSGHYLALRQPMRAGKRYFLLFAGPESEAADLAPLMMTREMQRLDKLQNEYILEWPGKPARGFDCPFIYDDTATNPTGELRQIGKRLIEQIQEGQLPPADRSTLASMQCYLDPDWFSGYLHGTSPENANFYTDYVRVPVALSIGLTSHPRFKSDLLPIVKGAFEMDLYHSITLPSGASQEAPGYMNHAFVGWYAEAPILLKYWDGYDASKAAGGRLEAAAGFPFQISQPFAWHFLGKQAGDPSAWSGRWMLPTGDTHPNESNLTMLEGLVSTIGFKPPSVDTLKSTDVEGFGFMLRDKVGSMQESFVGFKTYPHRGHYHGDQLSIHHCGYGMRMSIDLQAGYKPRPAEEYWHSKAMIDSSQGTSANMDGYERALGMATSAAGDAAVGEVTSNRVRYLPANPNDNIWQAVWPTRYIGGNSSGAGSEQHDPAITYRRTVVLVRGTDGATMSLGAGVPADASLRTYVVLRDQFVFPAGEVSNVSVANIFLQMDKQTSKVLNGSIADMGNGTAYTFAPAYNASCVFPGAGLPWGCLTNESAPLDYQFDRWDWASEGNEHATAARPYMQVSPNQTSVEMYTVLYPGGSLVDGHPAPSFWPVSDPTTGGLGIAMSVTSLDRDPGSKSIPALGARSPVMSRQKRMRGLSSSSMSVSAAAAASNGFGSGSGSGSSTTVDEIMFFDPGLIGRTRSGAPMHRNAMRSGSSPLVTHRRDGEQASTLLAQSDVSYSKSQGKVGPLILGAGYNFGPIPAEQLNDQMEEQHAYPWPPKAL